MKIGRRFGSDRAIAGLGFIGLALTFLGAVAMASRAMGSYSVVVLGIPLGIAICFSLCGVGLWFRLKVSRRHNREAQASIKKHLQAVQRELMAMRRASDRTPVAMENLPGGFDEKIDALEKRYLARYFAVLALEGRTWHVLSPAEAKKLAEMLHITQPLAVFELLKARDEFHEVAIPVLRGLAAELLKLGYTVKSQDVLRLVLERSHDEKLAQAVATRDAEVEVYTGAFSPRVRGSFSLFEKRPNCVLHVVGKVLPTTQSGYTLRTHYTALAQVAAGVDVHVCNQVGDPAGSGAPQAVELGGVTYHLPQGPVRLETNLVDWIEANVEALAGVVADIKPSILHAHSDFFNAMSARAVGDYFNIPVIYESRGFWEESWLSRMAQANGIDDVNSFAARWGLPDTYAWRREREHDSRMAADHVFTLAEVMKRRIVEEGCRAEKVSVVPNAVNGDEFPVQSRNLDLAAELGIEPDAVVVGYISSLVEYEGVPILLEAFRELRERTATPVRILVVGDGPVLESLRSAASSLGIPDAVFTGRITHDKVLAYYGLIDIFVVPRTPAVVCQLVTPLKPFEAFATGRAVVMSDVAALREISEASGSAALFTAGNSSSLATVLVDLVDRPAARHEMAASGAAWVRKNRSWEANAAVYNATYKMLSINAVRS